MNPIFLDLLICRKALKSLTDRRHLLLVTSSNHLLTSSKPFPKCVLDCKYPLFTKILYNTDLPPY